MAQLLCEFLSENLSNPLQNHWDVVGYRLPYKRPVNSKILVHQDIAEADNVCPGNQWILLYQVRTQPGGCLAYDGQLLRNGITQHLVGAKLIFRPARHRRRHPGQCLDNVVQPLAITPHRSRRIEGLSLGKHLRSDERLQSGLDSQIHVAAHQSGQLASHGQ